MKHNIFVEHKLTFIITGPMDKPYNYLENVNFWNDSHPLSAVNEELMALVPILGKCEDKQLEAFRMASNMYYDMMNNGTGNAHKWDVKKEMIEAFDSLELSKKELRSLKKRLSNVYSLMSTGNRFGWYKKGKKELHMETVEYLLTDIVYHTGLIKFPEMIKAILAQKSPYGEAAIWAGKRAERERLANDTRTTR